MISHRYWVSHRSSLLVFPFSVYFLAENCNKLHSIETPCTISSVSLFTCEVSLFQLLILLRCAFQLPIILSFPFHSFCPPQSVSHSLSILRLPLYPPHFPVLYLSIFLLSHIPTPPCSPLASVPSPSPPFSSHLSPASLVSLFTSLPLTFSNFFSVLLPLSPTPSSILF